MIKIRLPGRMGNNITSYCFARILHEKTGLKMMKYPEGMPFENQEAFPNAVYCDGEERTDCVHFLRTDDNMDSMLDDALAVINGDKGIILNCYAQNYKFYLPYRDVIRENWLYQTPFTTIPSYDDWILHLRREDYRESGSVLSLNYYDKILEEHRNKNRGEVYVIGKDIEPEILNHFREKHGAIFFNGGAINDFRFAKSFNNIICSNSTYSFWFSFLSYARKIFVPRPTQGYWSNTQVQKLQSLEMHIIVDDDNRGAV